MKNIVLITIIALITMSSCDKDDATFNISPEGNTFTFEAMAGGAILSYALADNNDIYGIEVEYEGRDGDTKLVSGSYLGTQIEIGGFIEEVKDRPANIFIINRNHERSNPIVKNFSTKRCGALSIFDNLEMRSYWSGFQIQYNNEDNSTGFINVGYVGMNAYTKELDTLLLETVTINPGFQKINLTGLKLENPDKVDAVVWTEDFTGTIVKKMHYKDVKVLEDQICNGENFDFHGSSNELEYFKLSWKYLFDGDIKGTRRMETTPSNAFTFCSGNNSVPGEWIIDLKEQKRLAKARIYCPLKQNNGHSPWNFALFLKKWYPNHVKVYASNDMNANDWVELGEYYEPADADDDKTWVWPLVDPDGNMEDIEQMSITEPAFMQITFDVLETKYQYVKIEVLELFDYKYQGSWHPANDQSNQVSMHEIEIYVEKE